jgi:hypothetical protein
MDLVGNSTPAVDKLKLTRRQQRRAVEQQRSRLPHLALAVIIALAYWPAHWGEPLTWRPRPEVELGARRPRVNAASSR